MLSITAIVAEGWQMNSNASCLLSASNLEVNPGDSAVKNVLTSVRPQLANCAMWYVSPMKAVQSHARTHLSDVHAHIEPICVQIAIATMELQPQSVMTGA